MKIDERIIARFNELVVRANQLISGREVSGGEKYYSDEYHETFHNDSPNYVPRSYTINKQNGIQWKTSCLSLLRQLFGINSDYYVIFENESKHLYLDDNLRSCLKTQNKG